MIDRERTLALLSEMGWTQATLARAVNVTPSAIQQIISGKIRQSRILPQIARALRVSEEYLTGQSDDKYRKTYGDVSPDEIATVLKGSLSAVDKSLGKSIADDEDFRRALFNDTFNRYWVNRQIARVSPELFREHGPDYMPPVEMSYVGHDFMSPTLQPGDQILISTASRTVDGPDGIWAIDYGGLPMVRRLMPLANGSGYRVSADNPIAPSFEAPTSDIRLRGLVFWCGRMLS